MRSLLGAVAVLGIISSLSPNAHANDPKIPDGAKPLSGTEVVALLDGRTFKFTGYDQPIVGTTKWDAKSQTVSGDYVWAKTEKGTFTVKWFIDGDKNCIQEPDKDPVCQTVYATDNGFMEINAKGKVHAVSVLAQ
jgi:hypothetical protein